MSKTFLFLAPLLVTAAIAAGCGDDGESDSAGSAPTAAPTAKVVAEATTTPAAVTSLPTEEPDTTIESEADESSASEAGSTTEVKMGGSTFAPATIDAKVGDTISFANDDQIPHTATSNEFDSGTLDPGASFEFTVKKAGTITYLCSFHPGMTGTIKVS